MIQHRPAVTLLPHVADQPIAVCLATDSFPVAEACRCSAADVTVAVAVRLIAVAIQRSATQLAAIPDAKQGVDSADSFLASVHEAAEPVEKLSSHVVVPLIHVVHLVTQAAIRDLVSADCWDDFGRAAATLVAHKPAIAAVVLLQ